MPPEDVTLDVAGPFAADLGPDNLAMRGRRSLAEAAGVEQGAAMTLDKRLPVASGIGGGSADAAAALRLLTSLWQIDPAHAEKVAPALGSDVPACLLSLPARGEGAGDELTPLALPELADARAARQSARAARHRRGVRRLGRYRSWPARRLARGVQRPRGAGRGAWFRRSRACSPGWARPGASFVRMSGSGATCFALVRGRGRAGFGGGACPARMVAPGDEPALRARA